MAEWRQISGRIISSTEMNSGEGRILAEQRQNRQLPRVEQWLKAEYWQNLGSKMAE